MCNFKKERNIFICVMNYAATFCRSLKFYCINKRNGNINKGYFALYTQVHVAFLISSRGRHTSPAWLLQTDQIQSVLDFTQPENIS